MYAQRVPGLVDRALARAGVTTAVRAKVQASLGEQKHIDGQVSAVSTAKSKRMIFVTGGPGSMAHAMFAFPPNSGDFQAELIRAQDSGRWVSVAYTEDASGNNVIDDIWIYAGTATSAARY
jgi:hypothetical protein